MSETKTPVTFHVFLKDGSKNPDIKIFFLEKMHVTAQDAVEGKLVLIDKTEWTLVLEPDVRKALMNSSDACFCIVSFQARHSGNYAIARVYNSDHKAKMQKKGAKA